MSEGRRRTLKSFLSIGGAVTAISLPSRWTKPVIESALLPAHAQSSPAAVEILCVAGDPPPGTTVPADTELGVVWQITPSPGVVSAEAQAYCNGSRITGPGATETFETTPEGFVAASFDNPSLAGCGAGDTISLALVYGGAIGECSWLLGPPSVARSSRSGSGRSSPVFRRRRDLE